jgi:mannose-6-phosphate isomerase-like protein (cupin superfamily)
VSGVEAFAFEPRRVEKPWGYELIWAHTEHYVGKELFVREGHALSLQFHTVKDETIYVQRGLVEFEIGPRDGELSSEVVGPGRAFRVSPGTVHRMRALEDSLLLEVSTPDLEDVVRLEDRYGRVDG